MGFREGKGIHVNSRSTSNAGKHMREHTQHEQRLSRVLRVMQDVHVGSGSTGNAGSHVGCLWS